MTGVQTCALPISLLTFTDSSQAIKNYYPIYNGVDYVVASQPVANTGDPIAPGVTLTTLGLPATSSENSSYLAKLAGTGINGKNNFALIVNGVIGLQKGAEAMSTGGAVFSSFKAPVAGALGSPVMPAFAGTNAVAVGGPSGSTTFIGKISGVGVLPATNTGIWTLTHAGQTLVARIGSPAPSTGGEVFKSFTTLADSNDGPHGPLFTAKLTLSANVTTLNSLGLWGVDVNGSAQLLARTGDTIPCNGAPRVLKNFIALKNATGSAGNGRGYDDSGHAFILAAFFDGTIGLIRITAP